MAIIFYKTLVQSPLFACMLYFHNEDHMKLCVSFKESCLLFGGSMCSISGQDGEVSSQGRFNLKRFCVELGLIPLT